MPFIDYYKERTAKVVPYELILGHSHVEALDMLFQAYSHYKGPMKLGQYKSFCKAHCSKIYRDHHYADVQDLEYFGLAIRKTITIIFNRKESEITVWSPTQRGFDFMKGRFAPPRIVGVWRSENLGELIEDDDEAWKHFKEARIRRKPVFVHQLKPSRRKQRAEYSVEKSLAVNRS